MFALVSVDYYGGASGLTALGAYQHNVANVNGQSLLNNSALGETRGTSLHVALYYVDAIDGHFFVLGVHFENLAALVGVFAAKDDYFVIFLYVSHY